MSKTISQEVAEVQKFFVNLTKCVAATEKKLLSIDSAFELEVTSDDSLSEAFLRKLIKEYVGNVLAHVDLTRR